MFQPVRSVSPVEKPRCPQCHCFVRLDAGTCTACGLVFALVAGTRRAETRPFEAQVVDFQNGPKGNAQAFTNLQPDGKIKRKKIVEQLEQMNLFQGGL